MGTTPLAAPGSLNDLVDPGAPRGTRFSNPVLSGAPEDGAAGIALLHKRARITVAHGAFSLPIVLPAGAIPMTLVTKVGPAYDGTTPILKLGTTANGAELVASVDLKVLGQSFNDITAALPANNTYYLSVAGTGMTVGAVTALLLYSVPAVPFQA